VAPDLSVPGHERVFAIGDTVAVPGVPGIAPAAKQMGAYVGRLIDRHLRGQPAEPPFRYRHRGNLATIGRKAAVADLGRVQRSGFPAWLLWALAHVWFLIGWRNRFVVGLNWLWNYVTFERGARLITAPGQESQPVAATPARVAA
jgi:NADH dehydrogenase